MQRAIKPHVLRDLLVAEASRSSDDAVADWRSIIGPLHIIPTGTRATAGWAIVPGGTASQQAIIRQAVAAIQAEHPRVQCRHAP